MQRAELEAVLPLDKIREYARTQPINRLAILGSFARGEHTDELDVDILVEFRPGQRVGLMSFTGIMLDLQEIVSRRVDLATPSMVGKYSHDSVYRDLVPIYETT